MNNPKPLYQPWNEEAFRADSDVWSLTPLQKWMYRTLLQAAFFESTRPYLPNDDKKLWKLAGCENKQQWTDNKDSVLEMFDVVRIGEQDMLSQKRVLADWGRLEEKREAMSDLGKRGANVRWASATPTNDGRLAHECQVREVSKKEKGSEERKVQQKQPNLLKTIPETCRKRLGVRSEPYEWRKAEFDELAEAYTAGRVMEVFEEWCDQNRGGVTEKPLLAFIKIADGLLAGTTSVRPDGQAQELNARLHEVGGYPFTGKHLHTLTVLLRDHSADEIFKAYDEFLGPRDPKDAKYAPKDFCEGGAEAILLGRKKRQKEAQQTEAMIERTKQSLQQKAEEEQKARDLAAREEAELVEEDPFRV